MKTNYTLKAAILLVIVTFCFTSLNAQVRIFKVDPATNSVTLKNFGSANAPISGYWFCVVPSYAEVSSMTAVTTLAPGEEVDIASSVNLVASNGEFALYSTSGFSNVNNIIDFIQWGTGSSGSSRESLAVSAGLWTANTFVTVAAPYQYGGDGSQFGAENWSTLGIDDFEEGSATNLYPNPSHETLNIQIKNSAANATVNVYDMLGKQVFNTALSSNVITQINISDWDTGMYLVKITSNSGEETKRFIKQ